MKMNSVAVGPELLKELGECAVGESKQMLVTVTVDSKTEAGLNGTITAVEPYVADEVEDEVEEPAASKSVALQEAMGA